MRLFAPKLKSEDNKCMLIVSQKKQQGSDI
jgi:hypothetical protein